MFRRILFASVGAMALTRAAYAAEPLPPPPPAPPPMWTGFYAGANAGGSWLSNSDTDVSTINVFDDKVRHTDGEGQASAISQSGVVPAGIAAGVIGGGQIGYNYQFAASWLAGIEADIQYVGVRGNGAFTRFGFEPTGFSDTFPDEGAQSTVRSERSADWLGTVRGRLGWLVTPTFLVFGDGGFAYGGVSSNTSVQSLWQFQGSSATLFEQWVPGYGGVSSTRGGWTAGGGAEWMFLPDWSLKAEYLYYSLGSVQYGLNTQSITFVIDRLETLNHSFISTRFNGNIVRAGLNYHFSWLPAPVVAKY